MTSATRHAKPLDRFVAEHQRYHGLSKCRSGRQLREINSFAEFSGKSPESCDDTDLRAYLAHQVERGLHVNTVQWKGNLLRPFFSWMFEAKLIDAEAIMAIRSVRDPNGASAHNDPRPYSAKELKRFWVDLEERWPLVEDRWFKYWEQGRSKYPRIATHVMRLQIEAIVGLALDCGLRRIEIFSAEIDHIHPDSAYVVVPQRGKRASGKDHYREVPFTEDARDAMFEWLEMRTRIGVKHDRPWVLASSVGRPKGVWMNPMSFGGFEELISTIGPWQLHRLRHTCATNWLRAGVSIEQVKEILGHATIQQTLRYAKLAREDAQKQVVAGESRFRQMKGRS